MATSTYKNRAKILDVREQRNCGAFEIREIREGGDLVLEGYASTFDPYPVHGGPEAGGWTEKIHPRAFDKTLMEKPDLQLLINHQGMPLARTKSGNLTLNVDRRGLKVRASLDRSDPDVQALLPKLRRGDMDEMSFSFRVKDHGWDNSYTNREIKEVSLQKGDVSVVNYGMNPTTSAGIVAPEAAIAALASLSHDALMEVRARNHAGTNIVAPERKLAKALSALIEIRTGVPISLPKTIVSRAEPSTPHGDVTYADPGYLDGDGNQASKSGNKPVKRYPINTAAHAKSAWSYINKASNAAQYTSSQLSAIKGRIKAACKKFGIEISEDSDSKGLRIKRIRISAGQGPIAILSDGRTIPLLARAEDTDIDYDEGSGEIESDEEDELDIGDDYNPDYDPEDDTDDDPDHDPDADEGQVDHGDVCDDPESDDVMTESSSLPEASVQRRMMEVRGLAGLPTRNLNVKDTLRLVQGGLENRAG